MGTHQLAKAALFNEGRVLLILNTTKSLIQLTYWDKTNTKVDVDFHVTKDGTVRPCSIINCIDYDEKGKYPVANIKAFRSTPTEIFVFYSATRDYTEALSEKNTIIISDDFEIHQIELGCRETKSRFRTYLTRWVKEILEYQR